MPTHARTCVRTSPTCACNTRTRHVCTCMCTHHARVHAGRVCMHVWHHMCIAHTYAPTAPTHLHSTHARTCAHAHAQTAHITHKDLRVHTHTTTYTHVYTYTQAHTVHTHTHCTHGTCMPTYSTDTHTCTHPHHSMFAPRGAWSQGPAPDAPGSSVGTPTGRGRHCGSQLFQLSVARGSFRIKTLLSLTAPPAHAGSWCLAGFRTHGAADSPQPPSHLGFGFLQTASYPRRGTRVLP